MGDNNMSDESLYGNLPNLLNYMEVQLRGKSEYVSVGAVKREIIDLFSKSVPIKELEDLIKNYQHLLDDDREGVDEFTDRQAIHTAIVMQLQNIIDKARETNE